MSARRRNLFALLVLFSAAGLASCRRYDPSALSLVLMPLPEDPRVCLRIMVRAGSANDPSGKAGLARLTWTLLAAGGSRNRPVEEIERAFYPLAAAPSLVLEKESAVFSATVPKEDLERFYGFFRDMLVDPGFREEDFERIKTAQIDVLEAATAGAQDSVLAGQILNLMAFEDHPYGHPETGTAESAAGLTLDDARAFYREHFVRGNIVIGLAGGFPADFPGRIEADFNALPRGFTPRLVLPVPRRPRGLEFVVAEKPAAPTTVRLGLPIDRAKTDKDVLALEIAAACLEGRRPGPSFADPDVNEPGRQRLFSIELGPVIEAERLTVIRGALAGLTKLVEEGIPEERFQRIRSSLLGSSALRGRSLAGRLGRRMEARELGREDFEAENREALSNLTRTEVDAAIRRFLDPAGVMVAVVTADAASLKAALAAPLNIAPEAVRTAPAAAFFQKPGWPAR